MIKNFKSSIQIKIKVFNLFYFPKRYSFVFWTWDLVEISSFLTGDSYTKIEKQK